MSVTHVVGIDPGLVHTGVVGLAFNPHTKSLQIKHAVLGGIDTAAARYWIDTQMHAPHAIFIEKYQPRSHLNTDEKMTKGIVELKQALPNATVLLNTGVVKVVRRPLLELLGCWKFSTVTHHQDLRSAARIAVLGMLKDENMNRLLAEVVSDHLNGWTWNVVT